VNRIVVFDVRREDEEEVADDHHLDNESFVKEDVRFVPQVSIPFSN